MNKLILMLSVLFLMVGRSSAETWTQQQLNAYFDGSRPALSLENGPYGRYLDSRYELSKTEVKKTMTHGFVGGAKKGASMGYFGVMAPAVSLGAEGFGRQMSRYYDGPREHNRFGKAMSYTAIALGAVLFFPAVAVGAAGAVVGAIAGTIKSVL